MSWYLIIIVLIGSMIPLVSQHHAGRNVYTGLNWLWCFGFKFFKGVHWVLQVFGLYATRFMHTRICLWKVSVTLLGTFSMKSLGHHQERIADSKGSTWRQGKKVWGGQKTIAKDSMTQSYSVSKCQVMSYILSCISSAQL